MKHSCRPSSFLRNNAERTAKFESLEQRRLLAIEVVFESISLVEGETIATGTFRRDSYSDPHAIRLSTDHPKDIVLPSAVTLLPSELTTEFQINAVADRLLEDVEIATITAEVIADGTIFSTAYEVINTDIQKLSHGPGLDEITLTPNSQLGIYSVANASTIAAIPAVVDLSVVTPQDQRISLPLEERGQFLEPPSLIKVDSLQRYRITTYGTDSTSDEISDYPVRFHSADADEHLIESIHVSRHKYSADTNLAAELAPGANAFFIEDASGWSNEAWESSSTRALAWYGYSNSTGHVYDDYTYTRNVAMGGNQGLWLPDGISYDDTVRAYRVDLITPWAGPTISSGTAVRNGVSGSSLGRPRSSITPSSLGEYTAYSVTIGGGVWLNGIPDETALPPGTEFIRPVLMNETKWLGLEVAAEQDAINYGPLDLRQHTVELNTSFEAVFDFDVLSKEVFGPSNTEIESVATPARGSAVVIATPQGEMIQFRIDPSVEESIELTYTLRNAETNEILDNSIIVFVAELSFEVRQERLYQVGIGLLNYESAHGRLPVLDDPDYFDESGIPHLSWRVHVLPWVGLESLYNQFNLHEPWDSPNNLPLATTIPGVFADVSNPANTTTSRYQIISREGDEFLWYKNDDGRRVGRRFRDFFDDVLHSLMVVETAADVAVPWTQPDLPNFDDSDPLASLGSLNDDYALGMTASGDVLVLPAELDAESFTALVTIKGFEEFDVLSLRRQLSQQLGGVSATSFASVRSGTSLEDNYFRSLMLSLYNFDSNGDGFPIDLRTTDDGTPLLSWRVRILPQLGYRNLYDRFRLDEPWNSAHNLTLLDQMPDIFRSAGDLFDSTTTRVQTFTYQTGEPEVGFYVPPREGTGWVNPQRGISFGPHSDANTIVFVEAGSDKAVPWTQPADLPFDFDNPLETLGSLPSGGFRAHLVSNFGPHEFSSDLPPNVFLAMATRRGGEAINPSTLATNFTESVERKHKLVALALLSYENAFGRFPSNTFRTDGTPLLSWRIQLLPFLGQEALYAQFRHDEPWDNSHNLPLLDYMPDIFRSTGHPADNKTTRVMHFAGPEAPYELSPDGAPNVLRIQDILDGTSLMVLQ